MALRLVLRGGAPALAGTCVGYLTSTLAAALGAYVIAALAQAARQSPNATPPLVLAIAISAAVTGSAVVALALGGPVAAFTLARRREPVVVENVLDHLFTNAPRLALLAFPVFIMPALASAAGFLLVGSETMGIAIPAFVGLAPLYVAAVGFFGVGEIATTKESTRQVLRRGWELAWNHPVLTVAALAVIPMPVIASSAAGFAAAQAPALVHVLAALVAWFLTIPLASLLMVAAHAVVSGETAEEEAS